MTTETRPEQSTPATIRLSKLLESYTEKERLCIFTDFEQGIISGDFAALPLEGENVKIKFVNEKGKTHEREFTDELIFTSSKQKAWFDKKAKASRELIARETGNFSLSPKEVSENPKLAEAYTRMRQEYLAEKAKGGSPDQPTPRLRINSERKPRKEKPTQSSTPTELQAPSTTEPSDITPDLITE